MARLDGEGVLRRRRSPARLVLPGAAAAAAALLLALALGALTPGDPTDPDAADPANPFTGAAVAYGDVDRTNGVIANTGDGPARLDLRDDVAGHATIVLAPTTRLRPLPNGRVSLERGRLYVRTSRPLAIDCGASEVSVLGTAFSLVRDRDRVEVRVVDGRVALRSAGGRVLLDPGTAGEVVGSAAPAGPRLASAWDALGWIGRPRLELRGVAEGDDDDRIELEIALRARPGEPLPIRRFSPTTPDFVLEITDPQGRAAQVTLQGEMILRESDGGDDDGRHWLARDRPYLLRFALRARDLGSRPGTYTMVASYSVPETAGTDVLHGRFESEPITVNR